MRISIDPEVVESRPELYDEDDAITDQKPDRSPLTSEANGSLVPVQQQQNSNIVECYLPIDE
ncbi:predicted protein [Botrytis cinerea T4]|uniref:Uncharacterized protein n=1 Tax=Botryotinia fuckeliana (strain T4) TaxID=999810 RepID=G2YLT5_BOTF4|nr:predicted protein [Botrytis cinerea T4]